MSQTPSWLSNDQPAVSATTTPTTTTNPSPLEVDASGAGSSPDGGAAADQSNDEKELPGVILTMRLANMGVAAYLITVSVRTSDYRTF